MSLTQSTLRYPRLRHCTLVGADNEESLLIVVGQRYFKLDQVVGSREMFLMIKSLFDGRHSVEEISSHVGVSLSDICDIVATFEELGLLRCEEPKERIERGEFLKRIQDSCGMWSQQIGYHRLFRVLDRGEVRREVFMGLLLETYHYVHSAPRHISVALSACTDKRWSDLLRSYLEEERVHSELILRGLENMGMPREWTLTAHPVIGTMSLIHMLCEIGRQSTLAYFTCTALFEARAEDFAEAKQAFEELGGQYGFSSEALAPIIEHMKCDAQAGHAGLLEKALEHVEHVSASDAHLVVNCLHDLKHSYDQFHDQVLQYYSDTSNYIPRLKVDYFSL